MTRTVGVRQLRQNASQVLAQVEQGETFIVTVQGRDVGLLGPAPRIGWVSAERMQQLYEVPGDPGFWDDIASARAISVQRDPWAHE